MPSSKRIIYSILSFLLVPILLLVIFILIESLSYVIVTHFIERKAAVVQYKEATLGSNLSLLFKVVSSAFRQGVDLKPLNDSGDYIEKFSLYQQRPRREEIERPKNQQQDRSHDIYTYTGNGSRLTVYPSDYTDKNKHFILLGGSYAFGHGLPDEDTLTSQLAQLASGFEFFNFGFQGGGPVTSLALVSESNFSQRIQQESGLTLFLWTPFHINRIKGMPRNYFWYSNFQYIDYLDSQKKDLGYARKHIEAMPTLGHLMLFISNSFFFRLIHKQDINLFSKSHVRSLTCDLFKEMRLRLRDKLPQSKFLFVSYDGSIKEKWLKECLNAFKIDFLEFEFNPRAPGFSQYDLHPTRQGVGNFAENLIQELKVRIPEEFPGTVNSAN